MSLDGRIAIGPNRTMFEIEDHPAFKNVLGSSAVWEKFSRKVEELHNGQIWMEGSNMLVKEGEKLISLPNYTGDKNKLYQDYLPEDQINHPDRKGWLAVVDGRGRVRMGYKGGSDKFMIHFVSKQVPAEYLSFLQEKQIPYLIAGSNRVDLKTILMKLKTKLSITTVYTSSGGQLAGALIRQGLLDEINILFNPVIFGGYETPTLFRSLDLNPPKILPIHLEFISTQIEKSGRIWVRYKVKSE